MDAASIALPFRDILTAAAGLLVSIIGALLVRINMLQNRSLDDLRNAVKANSDALMEHRVHVLERLARVDTHLQTLRSRDTL